VSTIVVGDEETMGTPVDQAKTLASQTHCGSIDDGHQILDVLREKTEEQPLITIVQIAQV